MKKLATSLKKHATTLRKHAMLLTCLFLTGCQAITFSIDDLLNAPNIADEQSAIYQALIESAGRGIALEYPRNGDYRSAFVLYDIDGDGEDETLAFYSVSSVSESNVKISVLDRGIDGRWRSQYELAGAGSSVERVLFSGTDMVVGYSAQDYEENAMRMYRYSDGILDPIHEGTYSVLEKADLDGCGKQETAIVRRSGLGIEVEVLKAAADGGYTVYALQLEENASAISASVTGDYDGKKAMYLDISTESGGLLTEIFYLSDSEITCPTALNRLTAMTQRPAGYQSRDYDGDGIVEIPYLQPFTGYESAAWGEGEYMTNWFTLTDDGMAFELKSLSYTNLRDGYILTIPNRWLNMVTVSRDQGTGEVTFMSYDQTGENPISEPIVSFASADSSGGGAYESAGYTVLYETDFKTFYVKTVAKEGEPLILTMDEIRDNFHIIQQ